MQFEGDDKPYSVPEIAPLYPEGPYEYRPFTALLFEYTLEPGVAERIVPDPLEVNSKSRCVLGIFRYENVDGFGSYNELMTGLPVSYDGRSLFYSPYLVLDADAPMAAGREVWGIPKKYGSVSLDTTGSFPTATVSRNGMDIVTASASPRRTTDDHLFKHSQFDNVYRKRIPSASRDTLPVVDRLVVGRTTDVEVAWATIGSGDVTVRSTADDPLKALQPNGDVDATLLEASWTLERVDDALLHVYEETRR